MDCPDSAEGLQSWNSDAIEEHTGQGRPPGSIYSGPFVLPLRVDFRIAPGLRGDYGLCWAFDIGK